MRWLLILYCAVHLFSCSSEYEFRPQLQIHINKLRSETALGNNDSASLAFLKDSCSRDELVRLINHKAPIIRVLSYRTLVNKKDEDFFEILKNHLSDTSKLSWWYFDDAVGDFTVSDLMIRKAERWLTNEQKDSLVNLVLLKHPYLETADWMIQDIEPNRAYYSIIKSKALSKVSRCGVHMGASYALAGFKKQEDVQILKENFCSAEDVCTEWAFRAIETFPDTAFYPVLISYFENVVTKKKQSYSDDLRYFCQALAQYKTATSLSILTALTKKETYPDSWYLPQNREYVFRAIHKYYSPPYKKIYQELKPTMSANVMEYLDKPAYDEYRTW